jgi:predicted permease
MSTRKDFRDEIESHLAIETDRLVADGMKPDDARLAARRLFGNVTRVEERFYESHRWMWLDRLAHDLRGASRILTGSPGLSATAVTLIALVVGGNTTIYSIVHALLTKPAPAVAADGLVSLGWAVDKQPVHPGDSYPNYVDVASQSKTVTPLLAFQFDRFTLALPGGSYAVNGGRVSTNYFETLGLRLARGRAFTPEEARLDASGLVVVISHRLWQERLNGEENAVGQSVLLNGRPATVVGIAPPRFQGVWLNESADVWVPILAYARLQGREQILSDRSEGFLAMIGRLRPGVSFFQAQAELTTIAQGLQKTYPATNKGKSVFLFPYSATAAGDSLIAQQGPHFLQIFSVVTALTLLIVCANVANLMLGRAVVRQREMALRQALGASRGRIVGIFVAEGFVIAMAAWIVASLFAFWMSKAVLRLMPPTTGNGAPLTFDFTPDWNVIGYAMVLALAGTIIFSLAPALRAWRQDLLPALKSGELGVVTGRSGVSNALVVVQLAFSVLLLTSAGLAFRSLSVINASDLGFDQKNLLLVTINPTGSAQTPGAVLTLIDKMLDAVRAVPGVSAASFARRPPQETWRTERVRLPGSDTAVTAEGNDVGAGYLETLGVTPIAGAFDQHDGQTTILSAAINKHLAETLWPGEAAVGRTFVLSPRTDPVRVAAVIPNGYFSGYRRQADPDFVFLPARQTVAPLRDITLLVRHTGNLDVIAPSITRALRSVEPRAPVVFVRTMESQLESTISLVRALTILLTLFAAGSLLIAAIGQYAAMTFATRTRVREFGVRMALGASSRQILTSVVGEGWRLTIVGLGIGLGLSLAAARGVRAWLYGVTPTDVRTYAGVFVVLTAASLVACYWPAHRASRIDPLEALRQD